MSDTSTPRSDAAWKNFCENGGASALSYLSDLLETELTAALAANESLVKERDAAREDLERARRVWELSKFCKAAADEAKTLSEENDQLRSQLEASQAECAQLNRELGKRFDLEKVIDERDDDLNGLKLDLEKAQAECERLRKDKELIVEAIRSAPCPPSNSNGDYKCRYSRNSIAASWWSCACPLHVLIGEDLSKKPYAAMQPVSGEEKL